MKRNIVSHILILIVFWCISYFGFGFLADRYVHQESLATDEARKPSSPPNRDSLSRLEAFLAVQNNVDVNDRLEAWGLKHPKAVADYLVQQGGRNHILQLQSFLLKWFLKNPDDALAWLDEADLSPNTSLNLRSKLLRDVLFTSDSPAKWQAIALSFPPGREAEAALAMTSIKIYRDKPEMLSQFVQAVKNPRQVDICYKTLAETSIATDSEKAIAFAEEIGDSRLRLNFYTSIFPAAAQNNLENALLSLTRIAVRSEQVSAIRSIIRNLDASTYDQVNTVLQNSAVMELPYMREVVDSSLRARVLELAAEDTKTID